MHIEISSSSDFERLSPCFFFLFFFLIRDHCESHVNQHLAFNPQCSKHGGRQRPGTMYVIRQVDDIGLEDSEIDFS